MKNTFLIILLNCLTAIFVFAQTTIKEKPYTFAPDWEEFSIKNSEIFTSYYSYKNVNERNAVRRYKMFVSDGHIGRNKYFFIFSEPRNNPNLTKKVYEFVKYSEATGSSVKIGNFQGKKFRYLGKDSFYHTILIINSQNRAYVFQTTSELDENKLADNFFAGIRLHSKNIPPKPTGIGHGMGPGFIDGTKGCGGDASKSSIVYTPLIFLSKPIPQYTAFARFYEITGNVWIEVKYLENGNLGEIRPSSKLPFGLTESAVDAAKQIKFKPPTADGRPFTTTQTELYSFTLSEKP